MKNKYYDKFVEKVKRDIEGVVKFAFAFIEATTIQEIVNETIKKIENEQE